jgi:hypothetical protein
MNKTVSNDSKPTFSDVKENQFFICRRGRLCQKIGFDRYNVITNSDGLPYSDRGVTLVSDSVERILFELDNVNLKALLEIS